MNLPYRTVQDAACALKERCFRNYHLLPYNWHDPTRNPTWWLSPATDRVAYRYGKAAFETNEKWVKPRHVFCGFWVEKGLVTGDAGGRHNEIMQPNWFWHRFVKLAGCPLASKIEEARGALGHNLSLAVTAGILGAKETWGIAVLDVDGEALVCRPSSWPGDGTLAGVASCSRLRDFASAIRSLDAPERNWHWVVVLVGHEFALDPSGPDDLERLAAMLEPFRSWMIDRDYRPPRR